MNSFLKKRELAIRYGQVFGSEAGKTVLEDLMREGNALAPTYVRGDTHETAFKEGQRNIVHYIFMRLNVDMEKLAQMAKGEEAHE